jgi:hypothetical protein
VNRPTLAAGATLFDRLDERMLRGAEDGQTEADQFCEQAADLGGVRPAFCDWRDRNRGRRPKATKAGNCSCGCGCGCGKSAPADQAGRLARAEQAERELAKLLVRLLLPVVIAEHQPAPRRLGCWPPGYVPPHTW